MFFFFLDFDVTDSKFCSSIFEWCRSGNSSFAGALQLNVIFFFSLSLSSHWKHIESDVRPDERNGMATLEQETVKCILLLRAYLNWNATKSSNWFIAISFAMCPKKKLDGNKSYLKGKANLVRWKRVAKKYRCLSNIGWTLNRVLYNVSENNVYTSCSISW